MNFIKVADCKMNRDRLAELGRLPRPRRGPQLHCWTCGRWCYEVDRCNLFQAQYQSTQDSASG